MPRGRTRSKLSLKQRRTKAFDLFNKGYDDAEVARRCSVTRQTANNYRKIYERQIHEEARQNPTLLREVLANTMRSLKELDQIRSEAWKNLDDRKIVESVECYNCGEEIEFTLFHPVSDQSRSQYLNVLLKAQDQRAKLFGVIGVKADMLVAVAQVKIIQQKILEWMATNLEGAAREALAVFLENELAEYLNEQSPMNALDVIDVRSVEETTSAA